MNLNLYNQSLTLNLGPVALVLLSIFTAGFALIWKKFQAFKVKLLHFYWPCTVIGIYNLHNLLVPICFLPSLAETIWLIFVATIILWSEASCWGVKRYQFRDLWLVTGYLTKNLIRFCGQQKTTDGRVVSSVC